MLQSIQDIARQIHGILNTGTGVILLSFFLMIDLFFVVCYAAHSLGSSLFVSNMWDLESERTYSEIFQYLKFGWTSLGFLFLASWHRCSAYLAWAALFLYLLFDDALGLHERLGNELGFRLPAALRYPDSGQLLFSSSIGAVALAVVLWLKRRAGETFRRDSRAFILLLGAFGFFAVLIDALHANVAKASKVVDELLVVVEEGGEMIVASVMLVVIVRIVEGFTRSGTSAQNAPRASLATR